VWSARAAKRLLAGVLTERTSLQLQYLLHFRRPIDLTRPARFTEKVQHYKLHCRHPIMTELVDKIEAKRHVAAKLGQAWTIPNLWTGERLPPRAIRNWTIPYVVKASHGCGWNRFVRAREDEHWPSVERSTRAWLDSRYGWESGQWAYLDVPPRLLVEPFLTVRGELLTDYKFFVFSGSVHYIQVDISRETRHQRAFYNRNWIKQPFTTAFPLYPGDIHRPKPLTEMISAAETLARDFPFARVDLYEFAGQPKFGEITFYPGSGYSKFEPPEYDLIVGRLWQHAPAAAATQGLDAGGV
jgi:hypothetical protein